MPRLKQRDLAAFSQALTGLYADAGLDTLSGRVLAALQHLFDCDFVSFALRDPRFQRCHTSVVTPEVPDWPGEEIYQRHLRDSPGAAHIRRTGDPGAMKMSDFMTLPRYRSSGLYTEVFGRVGCDRRLGFGARTAGGLLMGATLNRKGRDFSEEDRGLLDLLRPHLLRVHAQARASRLATVRRERERTWLGDLFGVGLGEIDARGRICWITPHGDALLTKFFPVRGHRPATRRLPDEMEQRLAATLRRRQSPSTDDLRQPRQVVWRFPGPVGRTLKVRLGVSATVDRWLLLLEDESLIVSPRTRARLLNLTPREAQVLQWLKQGKTNWEIGKILGIAERTAGKHLENIFVKLSVETRTAAVRAAAEAGTPR